MATQECFVLGSGFSKAIHPVLPTLQDLSEEVWKRLDTFMNGPVEQVEKEPFERNVEFLLSYLRGNYPWLRREDLLQNQRDFVSVVKEVVNVIKWKRQEAFSSSMREQELPDWVGNLIKYWHDNKSSVITLNYDTCIERLFHTFYNEWTDHDSDFSTQEFYPIHLKRANPGSLVNVSFNTFDLFKLHGSTNWFYSGHNSYPGEEIKYVEIDDLSQSSKENKQERKLKDMEPLIIPPITDKSSIFDNTSLRLLWQKAVKPLNNAHKIYFLGYSFPTTDMTMRFFFSHISDPTIIPTYVVNAPDVKGRYEDLLDSEIFKLQDDYLYELDNTIDGRGPISEFVSDLVNGEI